MHLFYFFQYLNSIIWGIPMIIILLGVHLYFTIKTTFVQKHLIKAIKYTKSSLSTLTTTLAATLGTGNIIGVATAVAMGGPGAVFWCWITGVLGMATSYSECYLGIKYREKDSQGRYRGGPMYVLEKGLDNTYLAVIFSICTLLGAFGVGCTTQSGAISSATKRIININPYLIGFVTAILAGLIIIGGIQSIAEVTNKLVPSMALFYGIGCIIILLINNEYIIESLKIIWISAFQKNAILGGLTSAGFLKSARYGVARGLFTNEAGLGSAPIAAAETELKQEKDYIQKQSLISMTATFWDTVVMCAVTGIVIVSTLLHNNQNTTLYISGFNSISDTDLTYFSFSLIPNIGEVYLAIALICFAFATIIGWSFFGERAFIYLFGDKYLNTYKIIYLVMIFLGAIIPMKLIWEMCDFFNAFMAVPNIIALILLRNEIKQPK